MIGIKTVLHIAGINFSKQILKIGSELGTEWFICVHTTGRYSKFRSASIEYIKIEDKLLSIYPNLTILRPTLIYGSNRDRNMWKLINYLDNHKFFPVFGSGDNLMQPVHAQDLGDAYFKVLNNQEKTVGNQYNLSGRDRISYLNLLNLISSKLKKKIIFINIPFWISLISARFYNLIFKTSALVTVEQVLRMKEDKIFSWEKAAKDFGYSPLSFEEGIYKEVDEFLENKIKTKT